MASRPSSGAASEWAPAANGDRVGLQGYGHYLEEYVREEGQWCIGRLHLARLRVDALGGR